MLGIFLGATFILIAAGLAHIITRTRRSSNLKPLPGPRGIPYVGVPHKLVPSKQWLQFFEWSKEYGPIYQTQIMGEQLVIIGSAEVQNDLTKRTSQFGDRPVLPAMKWQKDTMIYPPLIQEFAKAKHARRICLQALASIPKQQLAEACLRSAKSFLQALHADPDNVQKLCTLVMSEITCTLFYARPEVAAANCVASATLLPAVSPGAQIASKLPVLSELWHTLPDFIQPWKTQELQRRRQERAFWLNNLEHGRAASAAGTWTVAGELDRLQSSSKKQTFAYPGPFPNTEGDNVDILGMLAIIGSILLATTLQMTIIAMCQHPEWQAKAAAELDRVCPDRLPVPTDLSSLPILRAIIREVHRWRPGVPMGAPHINPQAQEYNGYEIPAGSSVLSVVWIQERNETLYPKPEEFRPERWLESGWPTFREPLSEYPKLKGIPQFGWGDRKCIGEEYTDWLNVMLIGALLKTTVVGKRRDEVSGEEIEIDSMNFDDFTIFIKPKPWRMDARMRSEEAMKFLD